MKIIKIQIALPFFCCKCRDEVLAENYEDAKIKHLRDRDPKKCNFSEDKIEMILDH